MVSKYVQLYGISLGLVHLHSHRIVHGDLKAVRILMGHDMQCSAYNGQFHFQLNVLIDDSGKAVLCDFGLSRIKTDTTSRTARPDGGGVVGTCNWMAPELLLGGSLKKPCDIYAFGMTLHEVCLILIVLQMLKLN